LQFLSDDNTKEDISADDVIVNEVSNITSVALVGFIDGESLLLVGRIVGDVVGALDIGVGLYVGDTVGALVSVNILFNNLKSIEPRPVTD
jgi:hypothetical protein